jgi:F0F1-type ATP synthase membrane subunit b/b'
MQTSTDLAVPPAAQPPAVPVDPGKALTATQQKNLQQILWNDFGDLRERTMYEIDMQYQRALDAIEKRYDAKKKLDAAHAKIAKAVEKATEVLQKAVEQIEATGLTFEVRGTLPFSVNFPASTLMLDGKNDEIRKATDAVNRLKQTAGAVIQRRQREAERKVLLAGITTTTASDLVNDFPKAVDIVAEVQAEMAVNHEDELKALGLVTTV